MSKVIEEVKALIKESNQTTDISRLIDINMKISGFLVYLMEDEIAALKSKLVAYNERREAEADFCLKSESGITKAEKEAVIATKKQRIEETETEIIWQRVRGFRTQVNEFVSALTQKIANLRREKELSGHQV